MKIALSVIVVGLVTGCFYAFIALALQIVLRTTRVLNFAQGDLVVGGMFLMWVFTDRLHLNPWVSLILLVPAGFLAGVLFELIVIRPLVGRWLLGTALAPLAAGIVLRGIYELVFGSGTLVVNPLVNARPLIIDGTPVTVQQMLVVAGLILCLVLMHLFLQHTKQGKAMRAVAENPVGAAVVGIDANAMALIALGLTGIVSAVAGGLMVPILSVNFEDGVSLILVSFVALVVGGVGSSVGAVAGGIFVGMVSAIAPAVNLGSWTNTTLLCVLLVALWFRPAGIGVRAAAYAR
jgi:branched-chain amino acid transport system permease protein